MMNDSPLNDVISRQYEAWPYPPPNDDLPLLLCDPKNAFRQFWPRMAAYPEGLNILSAGCGTTQAASIALHNPTARVLGIDVTNASLRHESALKEKFGLSNLELRQLPIEEAATLGQTFDLIVCTGVLHHLVDPQAGMNTLGKLLRPEGVAVIMLYAKYGRFGVETLMSMFEIMGVKPGPTGFDIVRDTVARIPPEHPIKSYIPHDPYLNTDAGIVDIYLQARARSYSVGDVLEFVRNAGLAFQGWLENICYYPERRAPGDSVLYNAVNNLPPEKIWQAMETFNTLNACHTFIATRAERPVADYLIDFASPEFLDFIPMAKTATTLNLQPDGSGKLLWKTMNCDLAPAQVALVKAVTGKACIRDIIVGAGINVDDKALIAHARRTFQSLWRLDAIVIRLP